DMVKRMGDDGIIFGMGNGNGEMNRNEGKEGGGKVVGTGGCDFGKEINNVLGFGGIFRGGLDVEGSDIKEDMKKGGVEGMVDLIEENELDGD
ncbi:Rossmann-fold NAD(P)-binding domain-containing protein, partial [Staphylococcus epidermidis]